MAKVYGESVNESELADQAVSVAKISDGAVESSKIASDAVGSKHIADGEISSSNIGASQVGGSHITDGEVDTPELSDGAVTLAKNKIDSGSAQVPAANTDITHNLGETPGNVVITEQGTSTEGQVVEAGRTASTVTVRAVTSGVDIKYVFQA